jgi:hypothetical protein
VRRDAVAEPGMSGFTEIDKLRELISYLRRRVFVTYCSSMQLCHEKVIRAVHVTRENN